VFALVLTAVGATTLVIIYYSITFSQLWCVNRGAVGLRPLRWCSGDLAGNRHAEAGHEVDHRAGDANFSGK
jgi:hypothetical protein